MSIFKDTFKPFICRQLNARQDLISQENGFKRQHDFLQYTTAKNSWVRMQSFVDYDSPDGRYKGNQMAKKYILESGNLYKKPDEELYSLRGGFANRAGSYGGDVGNRDYGIVPMPGISSIKIKNKSAYGSLREATVEFYCHDKRQLDDLEILFMRPGFPILLEWGWSLYLDTYLKEDNDYKKKSNSKDVVNKMSLSSIKIKNFDGGGINPFTDDISQQGIYDKIEYLQHKYSGNYDGMLGFIRNYSYDLLNNGGYKCTTTLISIGEVLDSLKMNSIKTINIQDGNELTVMSDLEIILRDSNLYQKKYTELNDVYNTPGVDYSKYTVIFDKNYNAAVNYIQFAFLIGILNVKKNLYDQDGRPLINIEIPLPNIGNKGDGYCLASSDSISIDNEFCTIVNPKATFLTSNNDVLINNDNSGFNIFNKGSDLLVTVDENGQIRYQNENGKINIPSFLSENGNGIIGNIYVNVDKIIEIYKNMSSNGDVYISNFIKEILKNISFSLGSINQFDLFSDNNTISIIDKFYLEEINRSNSIYKFQFNVLGKDSIIRNQNIQSKIFPSQATMIAIAAQSRENLGSIQTSTNNYLNQNVRNRLIKELNNDVFLNDSDKEKDNLINRIINLKIYVQEYIYKGKSGDKSSANEYLNTLINEINTDTNYKAIIPLSVKIDVDGIGGVIIGNIFTLNKDVLPSDYADKNIGFIVTGIEHSIEKNDWTTSYITQICLLDDPKLKERKEGIYDPKISNKQEVQKKIEDSFQNTTEIINSFENLVLFINNYFSGKIKFKPTSIQSRNILNIDLIELKLLEFDLRDFESSNRINYSNYIPSSINALNQEFFGRARNIIDWEINQSYKIPGQSVSTAKDAVIILERIIKNNNPDYEILKRNQSVQQEFDSQFENMKIKCFKMTEIFNERLRTNRNTLISKWELLKNDTKNELKTISLSIPMVDGRNKVLSEINGYRYSSTVDLFKFVE